MIEKVLSNLFVSIIELVAMAAICKKISKNAKCNIYIFTSSVILYLSFSIISTLYINNPPILFFVNLIILILYTFAFKISLYKRIIIVVIFNLLSMAYEIILALIISSINHITVEQFSNGSIWNYAIGTLICKFLLYVTIEIAATLIKHDRKKFSNIMFLHLALPITSFIVLFIQSFVVVKSESKTYNLLVILSSIFLIASNIVFLMVFDLLDKKENELYHKEIIVQELEKERKYYEQCISSTTNSNKTLHDLKHKLFYIDEMLGENNETAKNLISEMCNIVKSAQLTKYTVLNGLNVLLNTKFKEIESKNIKLKYEIFTEPNINIDELDLCILLGNLIDNAIEASLETIEKKILISIMQKNRHLAIKIINSTNNKVINIGETTKKDKGLHGYGLSAICDIVNKYDGAIENNIINNNCETILILKEKDKNAVENC